MVARLQGDLNAARKAQDKTLVLVLGTVLSDVRNKEIELRREAVDDEIADVLRKGIKRRREAIEMYLKAQRDDLVAKERAEVEVLEKYLPPAVGHDELRAAVRSAIASGAKNIGGVMSAVLPQYKGRAEASVVSAIAREELSRQG